MTSEDKASQATLQIQDDGQQPRRKMKWTKELKECVFYIYFEAEKGGGSVRREHLRIFLNACPHLTERINEQHLAGKNPQSLLMNKSQEPSTA